MRGWLVPLLTEGEILALRRVLRHASSDPSAFGFAPGRQTASLSALAAKSDAAVHMNEVGDPVQKKGPAARLDRIK